MLATQCAVKVMFIVTYGMDRVILHHTVPLRQTVNAAYTARTCAPPSSSAQERTVTLGDGEPHNSL